MSAKPQPMAGQTDPADDLIAELAKLMAQDLQAERPARPPFTLRIPGDDAADAQSRKPALRFDMDALKLDLAPAPASPVKPAPAPEPAPPAFSFQPRAAEPASARPADSGPAAADDFDFDFELETPPPAAPRPAAASAHSPAVPVETTIAADHDSIADLIAAELENVVVGTAGPIEPPAFVNPTPPVGADIASPSVAVSTGARAEPHVPSPRSGNAQPTPNSQQDRFKVPPVFGLGSAAPVAAQPRADIAPVVAPARMPVEPAFSGHPPSRIQPGPELPVDNLGSDPIDEIESLIGRAVRVELERPVEPSPDPRPVASPALRSLATPTVPVTPPPQPAAPAPGRAASGADEAILAAAEAAGVQIGWVEAPEVNEAEPAPAARAPRSRGLTRAIIGPLVAVTLLLGAGFSLYWVLGLGGESGPAPLLTADSSPIKDVPVAQPETAATQSVVFNEIDGVVPGAEEQLVSRDQTDVNEVAQIPPAAELSEEGLANRKVRTVTVRADGTIVNADGSTAGSTILPVDRPNVPDVPGADTASPGLLAATDPFAGTAAAAAIAEPTPSPAIEAPVATAPVVTPVTPGSIVPAVDLTGNPIAGKTAPVPMLRPAGLAAQAAATPATPVTAVVTTPVSSGNSLPPPPTTSLLGSTAAPAATPAVATPAPVAATPAEPAAATPPASASSNAPAYVQLASQRSEAEALATAQAMVTRFGPLFGGANMEVQRVDLGAKGIYYRVRVPATSMQDANNICTNVKAAGGDCFTM